jgi:hypothetical protein
VAVLEDGSHFDGAEFRSSSAPAAKITEAKAINGFLFFRLTGQKVAAPKAEKLAKAPKTRAPKVRQAWPDLVPETPSEAAP